MEEELATGEVQPAVGGPATAAGTGEEEAPPASSAALQVPTVVTTGARSVVVDLGPNAEDAETREEPEEAPAPSSSAADSTVAAPTIATEAELGGLSRAAQAGDADPAVTRQEGLLPRDRQLRHPRNPWARAWRRLRQGSSKRLRRKWTTPLPAKQWRQGPRRRLLLPPARTSASSSGRLGTQSPRTQASTTRGTSSLMRSRSSSWRSSPPSTR
ncbi:uncharacterized protein LOC112271061 [Brachypodium distachyon]|uniref:uncharacterized protein LOC112271061 n=1 Tax=Brachypodium distachyon TaxID=15368 RepID=UPI000D0D0BF0|nr:uncharacterized protein LOC112271061 [Brachypodium distachyon]|eukprot:XP_024315735.1 uncharacterized protein LOC112271061 [Brachypodium distachyon]